MRTDHFHHHAAKRAAQPKPLVEPVQQVLPTHSYRATLMPDGVTPSDVEDLADAGLLPTIRLKAVNATHAEAYAHMVTGKAVLRVERVEGGVA